MKDLPLRITDRRRDVVTMALATWLMVGLFVDGWAHNNLIELESFWTPWHGLFYSGFTATAAWMTWNVAALRAQGRPVPPGYGIGMLGLAVFAVGGVGDAIWHTIFGIETAIDALFSPTHLLLFVGLALILTTPIRGFRSSDPEPSFAMFRPVVASLALTAALIQFIFMYASGLNHGTMAYQWIPGEPDGPIVIGVLSMLLTTAIVFGPTLWAATHWRLPFGTYTVVLGTVGILMQGIEEFSQLYEIVTPLVAGFLIDVISLRLQPSRDRARFALFAFAGPLVLWSVHMLVFELTRGVGWPIEIWTGAILWTGFAGWGISLLLPSRTSERVSSALTA